MPSTYKTILESHKRTCDWFSRCNIDISRGRLGEYGRFLENLVKLHESGDYKSIEAELDRHLNSLFEASELSIITEAFSDNQHAGIPTLLKEIASGTGSYLLENTSSSNKARNYAFEVLVAARFQLAGIPVYFSDRSDVKTLFDDYEIFIECKRLRSRNKIDRNLKDAKDQLTKSFKRSTGARKRGIIALDITRLENPEFKLLITESSNHLEQSLVQIVTTFIQEELEQNYISIHNKILGILVRYSGISMEKESNSYVYCQQYSLMSTSRRGSRSDEIVHEIHQRMKETSRVDV